MRLEVKGKNVDVAPDVRDYAERRLGKLARVLADDTVVEVELSEELNPSIADGQIAEATVYAKGSSLRAHAASPDLRTSIDALLDKLERQVKRDRERRRLEPRRHVPRVDARRS